MTCSRLLFFYCDCVCVCVCTCCCVYMAGQQPGMVSQPPQHFGLAHVLFMSCRSARNFVRCWASGKVPGSARLRSGSTSQQQITGFVHHAAGNHVSAIQMAGEMLVNTATRELQEARPMSALGRPWATTVTEKVDFACCILSGFGGFAVQGALIPPSPNLSFCNFCFGPRA